MSKFYSEIGYVKQYVGEVVVIKCGGETLNDPAVIDNVIEQAKYLNSHGVRVVLVHGGGNQISSKCQERGIDVVKRQGERYTTPEVMDVVDDVMAELNALLVERINAGTSGDGVLAKGLSSKEFMLMQKQDGQGLTGEPVSVYAHALHEVLDDRMIAVVNPVSVTEEGEVVNVNADSSAGAIARELKAKRAVFCTAAPGVLDKNKDVISTITPSVLNDLIADGTITDGMVKKVRESSLLLCDVEGVAILGSADTDSILQELYGEGSGTLLEPDSGADVSAVYAATISLDSGPRLPSVG